MINMTFGNDSTTRKRKVIYDDYTNGFYLESRAEALQRQVEYRTKATDVLNRSADARLNFERRQVDAARHLFQMRREREVGQHMEHLRDHVAYKLVLDKVARERETLNVDDSDYGKYGPGISRLELDEEVLHKIHDMSPTARRKRETDKLLRQRKKPTVFDRNLATPEIFQNSLSRRKNCSASPKNKSASRKTPKLILPPITVKLAREDSKPKISDSVSQGHTERGQGHQNSNGAALPSIFLTADSDL